jgi:molecular chaperone DnaJ
MATTTNAYETLGVPRDADASRIRRAFRELFHHLRPERSHADATRLGTAQAAFDALCDGRERAEHDRALLRAEAEQSPAEMSPPPVAEPIDLMNGFDTHHPSRGEIQTHFARNFSREGLPKSRTMRELTVELTISPEQAMHGGTLPIDVPVAKCCAVCEGTGTTGHFHCDACDGHGLLWDVARVDVILPAPVRDNTNVPVSLRHLGVENLYLRVNVRVAPTLT